MNNKLSVKEWTLIFLLILISIIARLNYEYENTFDSYTMHASAESINIYGFAKWIFHPASLFGYYPLSYPSGLMFLLAFLAEITGLSMNLAILLFGVFIGILGVFLLFLILYEEKGFLFAYFGSLIFSLSPYYLGFTSWNASGRIMIILFALITLLTLLKILRSTSLITARKLIILTALFALYGFLMHRTAQFLIVYIIAFIWALAYKNIEHFINLFRKTKLYPFFKKRYEKNNLLIIFDSLVLFIGLLVFKLLDLIKRGRLLINIQRRIEKYSYLLIKLEGLDMSLIIFATVLVLAICLVLLMLILWQRKKLVFLTKKFFYHAIKKVTDDFEMIVSKALFALAVLMFIRQFFGSSFYSPSLEEYYESTLLSGTGPHIVFINFVVNYLTTISLFTPFAIIGVYKLAFKKGKNSFDWMIYVISIAFSGLLLDKRYVRLFIIPLFSIFIGYSLYILIQRISVNNKKKSILSMLIFFTIILIILGGYFPELKRKITGEAYLENIWKFKSAGQYLKSLNCNCSTATTQELLAGVVIFSESGVPGASNNVYYYVNKSYLQTDRKSFAEVKDSFMNGEKVTELWILKDWIVGGQYYIGRHAKILFDGAFNSRLVSRVIEDYNERYYFHDKSLDKNDYLISIEDVKNKLYDNPSIVMYDMKKGKI